MGVIEFVATVVRRAVPQRVGLLDRSARRSDIAGIDVLGTIA